MAKNDVDDVFTMADLANFMKKEIFDKLDHSKVLPDTPEMLAYKKRMGTFLVIQQVIEKKRKELMDAELAYCLVGGTNLDWDYYSSISWSRLLLEEYMEILEEVSNITGLDESDLLVIIREQVNWRDRSIFDMLIEKSLKHKILNLDENIHGANKELLKLKSGSGGRKSIYNNAKKELESAKLLYEDRRSVLSKNGEKKRFNMDIRDIFRNVSGETDINQIPTKPDDKTISGWMKKWEKEFRNK